MTEFRTDRLLLRHARLDDVEAMHAILSNRQAMTHWSTPPHSDLDQTRDWIERMIANTEAGSFDFLIEEDGVVIGKAGFYELPEIGYVLHPDYWRRGFMGEVLSVLIPEVFARYDIKAIKAELDPDNIASRKLLDHFGFEVESLTENGMQIGDHWYDSLVMLLTRETYSRRSR